MINASPLAPEQSRLFFGNSHMNEVVLAIAAHGEEPFSPRDIIAATGLLGSIVHPLIRKLRGAAFVEYIGRVPGERTTLYRVRDNYWWDAARRYAAERGSTVSA